MADHSDNKLLHDILAALRSIRDEIHTVSQNYKPSKNKDGEPLEVDVTSELRLPVAITEHYRSQQTQWKAVWEKIKIGLELIGFFAAIFAAVFTIRTFKKAD